MSTTKEEVQALVNKLPDDCSLEDIPYHLYVIEKVTSGLHAADSHGTIRQEEIEQRLSKWLSNSLVRWTTLSRKAFEKH